MPQPDLSREIGSLLRLERERRSLTQQQFAEQAQTTQQRLSRIERGSVAATTVAIQELFEALGLRLRVTAIPLEAGLDEQIDRLIGVSEEERAAELQMHVHLLRVLSAIPFVLTGRMAAFAQGAPVPAGVLEIVVADVDLDRLGELLQQQSCLRYSEKWHAYCEYIIDPRQPGPLQWLVGSTELAVEVEKMLPAAVTVRLGEHVLRARPLADLEARDEELAALMGRVRARHLPAGAPAPG